MKKQIACVFGHKGGIGKAVKDRFLKEGYRIIPVHREVLDLNSQDSDKLIDSLLTNGKPDVVINASGVFFNGWMRDHMETMNVNFGSNWSIVRHYSQEKNQTKPTRIIMIGSSSHSGGRPLYPLYSASKAAVYNLWLSAKEQFHGTPIQIDLVNPVRTLTKMATAGKQIDPTLDYLTPEQVAEKIIGLVQQGLNSTCINMTFKDTK